MSEDTAKAEASVGTTLRANEGKWTKPLLAVGWTCIPSVIIERQRALGLDAIDMNIVMHLAMHWWTADNPPFPSKETIARALNVDPRTIQRRIAAMEAGGLLRREERRLPGKGSKTNIYHLDGLIKAATPFAAEKAEEMKQRAAEQRNRASRKGKSHLKLVSKD